MVLAGASLSGCIEHWEACYTCQDIPFPIAGGGPESKCLFRINGWHCLWVALEDIGQMESLLWKAETPRC